MWCFPNVTAELTATAKSASSALIIGDISYQHVVSLSAYAAMELGVKLGLLTPSFLALVGFHQTLIKMGVGT